MAAQMAVQMVQMAAQMAAQMVDRMAAQMVDRMAAQMARSKNQTRPVSTRTQFSAVSHQNNLSWQKILI